MFFIRFIINTIFIISFIGCGTMQVYENNQTLKTEPISIDNIEDESEITTPQIEPISTPTPSPTKVPINIIEDEQASEPTDESSIIDNILQNSPRVETLSTTTTTTTNNINSSRGYKERFINSSRCNQILDKEFFVVCYNYKLKVATTVAYSLEGDLVNELNIKDRPSFYQEELIDEPYRAKSNDYSGSGYDRGHLAPDASFDWSSESLEATYSLANIIPQVPIVNREMWVKAEQYARDKAVELGRVDVINVIKYSKNPKSIGEDKIAISLGYYKILLNEEENYKECFYYDNDIKSSNKNDNLSYHKVNCSNI